MREKEVEQIRNLPNGLGSMLEGQINRWWRFLGTNQNNPHDPLAALAMVRPDLFSFAPCDVAICMKNDRRGRLIRRDDPNGKIHAAYDLDVPSAERLLLSYITG
jgi:purine nucleosidase